MRESARIALTPSRAAPPPPSRTGSHAARRERLEIGRLVHTLMQELPDISPERRRLAAERFLERNAGAFDAGRREPLIQRVLEILMHPELAPLFAAGSRAEVAIAGAFPRPGRPELIVSGRIDRLAVMEDAVLLADFKTGWDPGGAPAAYVEQLALYRAALAQLQPNREIRAMLIWIETGRIATIASEALDEALSQAVDRAQP